MNKLNETIDQLTQEEKTFLDEMMTRGFNANTVLMALKLNEDDAVKLHSVLGAVNELRRRSSAKTPDPIRFHDSIPATRYNGGWCKTVVGLDKSKNNGYSILGDFVKAELLQMQKPGLYLDCDIDGSRKHPEKNYRLFRYDGEGVTIITEIRNGGADWAVRLWPSIESELEK